MLALPLTHVAAALWLPLCLAGSSSVSVPSSEGFTVRLEGFQQRMCSWQAPGIGLSQQLLTGYELSGSCCQGTART